MANDIAMCLNANGKGFDAPEDGMGRGAPIVTAPCLSTRYGANSGQDIGQDGAVVVAPPVGFMWQSGIGGSFDTDGCGTLVKNQTPAVLNVGVRRLTPRECERLQGFPDDYTLIPHRGKAAADGPRYKALGNSWAVPVPQWIGQRIEMVERLIKGE